MWSIILLVAVKCLLAPQRYSNSEVNRKVCRTFFLIMGKKSRRRNGKKSSAIGSDNGEIRLLIKKDIGMDAIEAATNGDVLKGVIEGFVKREIALKVTDELCKEISILPLNNRVYMVDYFGYREHDARKSSGLLTQEIYQCGLVEKEVGSNGKYWNNLGTGSAQNEADGLSYSLAVSTEFFTDGTNFHEIRRMVLGTIAKACKAPGVIMGQAMRPMKQSRPRKVLFASQGLMLSVEEQIKAMGIPEVGVADKKLIASMKSSFSACASYIKFAAAEKMLKDSEFRIPNETGRLLHQQYLDEISMAHDKCYVSEERVSLGSWRPDAIGNNPIPKEWYARPPPETGYYLERMLWGWRTNMELATKRNDSDKIKDICKRYSSSEVKDFVEMRMLLTMSVGHGAAKAVRALLKYANAEVDGILSKNNNGKWVPIERYEWKSPPLFVAIQEGHEAIVRLLIKHGANIHFSSKSTLLHLAVAWGHKNIVEQLILAGVDPESRDDRGHTPMDVCMAHLESGKYGTKQYEAIAKMLKNTARIKRCAACGAEAPQMHCPCRLESYCNAKCQKKRWKHHKQEHMEEMEILEV